MLNRLVISYFIVCALGALISYCIIPAGVNHPVLDFGILFITVCLGPFSVIFLGSLIPTFLLLIFLILGVVGGIIVIKGFKAQKINFTYLGSALWSISGTSITVFGFILGCC